MNLKRIFIKIFREKKLSEILKEFRWIYGYGLKYKRSIVYFICLGIFGTVFGLAGSVLSKKIIDAVTGYDAGGLMMSIIFYAFFQIFSLGINALNQRVSVGIEIKVDQEIRADIYGKIIDADWESLSEFHSGDLLNRVNSDVGSVASSVIGWIPELITRGFQFVGSFAVIMYYDATLAFLALLSAPAILIMSRTITKKMRNYNKRTLEMNSEAMIFEEESLQNVQMIKSFGVGELYREKFAQVQEKRKAIKLSYQNFAILAGVSLSAMGMLVTGACFGWGIYRLWSGHITFGTMTLFLQLAGMLRGSFSSLIYMVPKAISSATAAGRLMEITSLENERYSFVDEASKLIKENKGVAIRADNITFRYKSGQEVIVGSDFVAHPGEIIAVIGPSGGGKTTLFRILLGMVSVSEGSVEIGEIDSDRRIPVSAATRGLFSYVPQNNFMFHDTIAENMRIVNKDATDEDIIDALKQACAYEFVKILPEGIYSKVRENGSGFSEGQIQRLAIARALLSPAPIILLDEATSALDADTERKILDNVIANNQRRTLIFVTHRLGILPMCHRVYKIEQKILRTVPRDEIPQISMENKNEIES